MSQSSSTSASNIDINQLTAVISEIVRSETQNLLNSITPPNININNVGDQTIDAAYQNNLNDMDKIPDVVKSLREFSGKPGEFGSWKKSVDRILKIYENLKGTPKYFGILSVIRNKITGNADTALESYNTPLNWEKISKCLTLHYADKRDLGTLEYQMTTLIQGNNTIPQFYQEVYYHLSLILNKLSSMELTQDSLNVMTAAYRDKALDTFIRGLKGDLPRLLSMREPADLPEALNLCLKLENVYYRVQHSHGPRSSQFSVPSPIPRQTNQQRILTTHPPPMSNFYPQLLHKPQGQQATSQQFKYSTSGPQRQYVQHNFPPAQKQFETHNYSKPEPMDVDISIRSRQINYMNRPVQQFTHKRPPSNQIHQTNKFQRLYNLEQNNENSDLQQGTLETNDEQEYDQTFNEYVDAQEQPQDQLDDINFLRLKSSSLPYFEHKAKSGKTFKFLIDTGSNKNYVQPRFIQNPIPNEKSFSANSVAGSIKITHHALVDLFGENNKIKFFLLPKLKTFDGIIGNDTLKELGATIHTDKGYMILRQNIKVPLKQLQSESVNSINIRTTHLTTEQTTTLKNIIKSHHNLFADPDEKLTYTTKVKGEIRTITDTPVYSKTYPYPMCLKDEVDKQISKLLEDGIIRRSKSPYNSPVWIVKKKEDASGEKKFRLVIDYRKLNSVTIPDKYPIPEINDVLANLGQNNLFTVIDLKSGFHQIPLKESDIEKTAFSVNNGKYEFTRLPFGLRNAPSIFQRALDDILREHIGKRCYVYIDDIIIFGKTENEHFTNLELVFKTLELANMKIQLDKSEFLQEQVEFLGFIVSKDGIKANPKKVQAIIDFPIPKTIKELRSFLGMSGYYRLLSNATQI